MLSEINYLVIFVSILSCEVKRFTLFFLYFEKRAARKPDKNASMDINSYRKKNSESLHLSCVQVRTSYRLYFLHLKKKSGQIRIRGGANNCIGILILGGELGFFGQIFGPLVSQSNYLTSHFLSPTYQKYIFLLCLCSAHESYVCRIVSSWGAHGKLTGSSVGSSSQLR